MNNNDYIFNPLSFVENLGEGKNEDSYVSFLRKEIKKYPSIRNIGVIGPYGSGKSSIVHSFLKNKENDYKKTLFFSQETIAVHLYSNGSNEYLHDRIKKAIYLELLKYDTSSLLLKEYNENLLNIKKWKYIASYIFYAILSFSLSFALFAFLYWVLNWLFAVALSLSIASLSVFGLLFFSLYVKSVSFGFKSKHVEGKAELLLAKDLNNVSEQINSHPAELDNLILYIIKKNKIRYFVIEDMERLRKKSKGLIFDVEYNDNNAKEDIVLEIIKQFKILSDLINRSKIIKKPVRFIYGLNDECFVDSEVRSKFFDLIVPVIPLATYSSAPQAITEAPFIKQLLDASFIKYSTITSVAFYFKNQRQINAFLSQFYLNCQKLSKITGYDEILAITSLMVLFPHFSHSLYERNNSLDVLLSEEWFIDDSGNPALKSGKQFPTDILKEKDNNELPLFLRTCISKELITKSYKLLITAHKLADDKLLSENDVELINQFNGGQDISNKRFDNPDNVLVWLNDDDFFNRPYNFHPQLLDSMVKNNDTHKLNYFAPSLNTINDQKRKAKLLSFILNKCVDSTIEYIAKTLCNSTFVYNIAPSLNDNRNSFFAFCLLKNAADSFINTNLTNLSDYITFISSKDFFLKQNDNFSALLIEKMLTFNGFIAEDISSIAAKPELIKPFIKKPYFLFSLNNLTSLFPDFKSHPLKTLNSNKEVCIAFISSEKASAILEKCDIEDDYSCVSTFVYSKTATEKMSNLLASNYFTSWRFKILINLNDETKKPLEQSRLDLLLSCNLLDLNNAFASWYFANNPITFLNYVESNLSLISESNYIFDTALSSYLFENLAKEKLSIISGQLKYGFIHKNVSALDVEKAMIVFDSIDDNNAKQLFVKSALENEPLFQRIVDKRKLSFDYLNVVELTKSEIEYIFNNSVEEYYSVLLSDSNSAALKQFISESKEDCDFAKLIFLNDGTIRANMCADSLIEVCKYEVNNVGALEKVFRQIDDSVLRWIGWIDFIEAYINKYGFIGKSGKLSLPSNNINTLIYDRFTAIRRISPANGRDKSKHYFTINKEQLLY